MKKQAKNIKRERELQEEQRKQAYRRRETEAAEKKRQEEEAALEAEKQKRLKAQEARFSEMRSRMLRQNASLNDVVQSRAKAAGLKSTYTLSPDSKILLMTSFGRGSKAIAEKQITDGRVEDIHRTPTLRDVESKKEDYHFIGRADMEADVGDPLWRAADAAADRKPGDDLIDCRPQLEMRFFGRTFEDNIHIQLIYNVLDIDKLLSVHINNIILELDNMFRKEGADFDDFMGYLSLDKTYDVFMHPEDHLKGTQLETGREMRDLFLKLMKQPQLGYFGTVLRDDALNKIRNRSEKEEALAQKQKRSFYFLALIAMVRQAMAHGQSSNVSALFSLDGVFAAQSEIRYIEASEALDDLYGTRVRELNDKFTGPKHASRDLQILFRIIDADQSLLTREYYDFVVRKAYKNTGFSIKKLREVIEENLATELKDQRYDTVRSKLNRFFDFIVFRFYREHPERGDQLVDALRTSQRQIDKEMHYRREAETLWQEIGAGITSKLLPQMNGNVIAHIDDKKVVASSVLDGVRISEDASAFSKLMYLLCCFLDGKEINILLTTLINKFENIASEMETMEQFGLPCDFTKDYALLNKCGEVAAELRVINSFARMSVESPDAKKAMYMEAAEILGFPEDRDLEERIGEILESGRDVRMKGTRRDNGFRNFIANNVIESDRFKYLIRYCNAKSVRFLASNEAVLLFVLNDIPDTQILRYYNACLGTEHTEITPDMRAELARRMRDINFEEFSKVHQGRGGTPEQMADKERKKSIIRVYLTVMYLLIKNLVYVNSRYFLAFHCMERDSAVYDPKLYGKRSKQSDYRDFATAFIETHGKNHRAQTYIRRNIANSDAWAVREFRNCVMHLNAVRNAHQYIADVRKVDSYFGLYHYLMQRLLIDQYARALSMHYTSEDSVNPKLKAYFDNVRRYGSYCKDLVKALNVPFAYNLPRYKNLSIDALFDKNRPSKLKNAGSTEHLREEGDA